MKNFAAVAAAISIALAAPPAIAGVVIIQRQTRSYPQHTYTVDQTIMVQGNREKVVSPDSELIIDLDQGRMYIVDIARKNYLELPYPVHGTFPGVAARNMGLHFRKVGKSGKVAGYPCEQYTGTGKTQLNEFTVTECVTKHAPGALEFARFEKLEVAKLKASGSAPSGDVPEGIPLSSVRVTRRRAPNVTGLTAELRKQVKEEFKKFKPVTTTTLVSKIEEKKLPESTFEVAAGFTRQKIGMSIEMPHYAPHPLPPVRK